MMEMDDLSPELQKLKMKLARFVVAEKKKEVVKYLQRKRTLLMSLPLADNGLEVTLEQAHKDAAREKIAFNNQHYRGGWDELHRLRADLLEHTNELMANPECTTALSAEALANLVLIKASRTRNGGDAYVKTRMLFEPEGGEWVLKPLDRDTYPIDVKLMLHSRAIFTQISTMNQYGLYRMEDLMEGDSAMPWLPVDALVVEQIDLNNDRTFRDLRILSALDAPVRRKLVDRLFFRKTKKPKPTSMSSPAYQVAPPAHRSPPTKTQSLSAPSPDRKDLMGSRRYQPPTITLPEVPEETDTLDFDERGGDEENKAKISEDQQGSAQDEGSVSINDPNEIQDGPRRDQEGSAANTDKVAVDRKSSDKEIDSPSKDYSLIKMPSNFDILDGKLFNPFDSDDVKSLSEWFDKPSWMDTDNKPSWMDTDNKPSWFESSPSSWFDSQSAEERSDKKQDKLFRERDADTDDDEISIQSDRSQSESSFLDFDWPSMTVGETDNWFKGIFDTQSNQNNEESSSSSGEEEEDEEDGEEESIGGSGSGGGGDEKNKDSSKIIAVTSTESPVQEVDIEAQEALVLEQQSLSMQQEMDEESSNTQADELGDFLSLVGLSHFHLPLINVGIATVDKLKQAPEPLLTASGMKKVHVLKLKRALNVVSLDELPNEGDSPRLFASKSESSANTRDRSLSGSMEPLTPTATATMRANHSRQSESFSSPPPITATRRARAATVSASMSSTPNHHSNDALPLFPKFIPPQIDLPNTAQQLLAQPLPTGRGDRRGASSNRSSSTDPVRNSLPRQSVC